MAELAIILVHTQMPENIGATARAMMNFGLSDLRLVRPREEWPNKRAYDLAGHAAPILDNARLYETAREAVAGLQRVYAATARSREMIKPVQLPSEAGKRMAEENLTTGILFGPERTGLTNDDVTMADAIVTIPTASELSSLNIAQSVVVLAYEWFINSTGHAIGPHATTGPLASPLMQKAHPATKEQLFYLFSHLERELDEMNFWKVPDKKPKIWLNLRNIFSRANLTDQEARTLHGVIVSLRGKD